MFFYIVTFRLIKLCYLGNREVFESENFSLLRNVDLLSALSDSVLNHYFKTGGFRFKKYQKNTPLHLEGDKCERLEIILSGTVVVDHVDTAGKMLTVSSFGEGDLIGGNLIFSKKPYYPMTVTTRCVVDILEIDREILFELFLQNSDFLKTFLSFVSDNAFILGYKIKQSVNKTIREKILLFLEGESARQQSKNIKLPLTKTQLAESLGVERTSLSRELAKMRRDGLINFDNKSITILL